MNTWVILAIAFVLVLGLGAAYSISNNAEPAQVKTGCGQCSGQCSQASGCGSPSCGATTGGSCGCGK